MRELTAEMTEEGGRGRGESGDEGRGASRGGMTFGCGHDGDQGERPWARLDPMAWKGVGCREKPRGRCLGGGVTEDEAI